MGARELRFLSVFLFTILLNVTAPYDLPNFGHLSTLQFPKDFSSLL